MREFHSPSGRRWTARLFHFPNTGTGLDGVPRAAASGSVLRFQSDELTLDLLDWPDDWMLASDAELCALLRSATTPTFPPRSYLTPAYVPACVPGAEQNGS